MNDGKYDDIVVNLKIIAQVPRSRRLKTTADGKFNLEENTIFVPLKRTYRWFSYGEGRNKLISDLKALNGDIRAQIRLLLSSKYLDNDTGKDGKDGKDGREKYHDSDEKRGVLEQLACIHRELNRSITGFENLKGTYSSDISISSELEHIIDQVRLFIKEIEQKVPDVADNLSAIMIEKPI